MGAASADAGVVARREHVADAELERGDLAREAVQAPRERGGGERRARVEPAQDDEQQFVGQHAEAVVVDLATAVIGGGGDAAAHTAARRGLDGHGRGVPRGFAISDSRGCLPTEFSGVDFSDFDFDNKMSEQKSVNLIRWKF